MDGTAALFRALYGFKKDVAIYDILSCHNVYLRSLHRRAGNFRLVLKCQTQRSSVEPPGSYTQHYGKAYIYRIQSFARVSKDLDHGEGDAAVGEECLNEILNTIQPTHGQKMKFPLLWRESCTIPGNVYDEENIPDKNERCNEGDFSSKYFEILEKKGHDITSLAF